MQLVFLLEIVTPSLNIWKFDQLSGVVQYLIRVYMSMKSMYHD
jgi:hypothetical protein